MITIGSKIKLKYGLALAPMAGFTDRAFRKICLSCGAEYVTTEMVSAQALVHHDEKTNVLAAIDPEESHCAIQLFGSDPSTMNEATDILLSSLQQQGKPMPCTIDINMGCPVKKIVSNGEGSSLMKDPNQCFLMIQAVKKASMPYDIPVSAKIRAGFDNSHMNGVEVAKALFEAGADSIAIHGRTREEMYRPGIHFDIIAQIVEALPHGFPIFGNGDITTPEDALHMIKETGVPGVMIGRGALGNPWLFSQIISKIENTPLYVPSTKDRIEMADKLMKEIINTSANEASAVCECRGRISHFLSGIRGSAAIRNILNKAVTYEEARQALALALK